MKFVFVGEGLRDVDCGCDDDDCNMMEETVVDEDDEAALGDVLGDIAVRGKKDVDGVVVGLFVVLLCVGGR